MKKRHRMWTPLLLSSLFLAAAYAAPKHWGYEYSDSIAGPTEWGAIAGDALCALGKEQSPINIRTATVKNGSVEPTLKMKYQPTALNLVNNGHTIQQDFPPGSTLQLGSKTLTLKQFHFHAPSENQIDGKSYPLELHLVHVDGNGKPAAVVALFIKEGGHNSDMDAIFSNIPKKEGQREKSEASQIDVSKFLPDDLSYFLYKGSLTTPPCSEGLSWYVLREAVSMDTMQIKAFTSILDFAHNSRPVQALGARSVLRKEAELGRLPST